MRKMTIFKSDVNQDDIKKYIDFLTSFSNQIVCDHISSYIKMPFLINIFKISSNEQQNIFQYLRTINNSIKYIDDNNRFLNSGNSLGCQSVISHNAFHLISQLEQWDTQYGRTYTDIISAMRLAEYNANISNEIIWRKTDVFYNHQLYVYLIKELKDKFLLLQLIDNDFDVSNIKNIKVEVHNREAGVICGDIIRYVHFKDIQPEIRGKVILHQNCNDSKEISFVIPNNVYSLYFDNLNYSLTIINPNNIVWKNIQTIL